MSAIVPLMEAVVRRELASHRTLSLGVVSEVFTNSAGDGTNHLDANVRLHGGPLVLQHVPVAVGRAGISTMPRPDDLVVLGFLDGEPDGAIVLGVLHGSETPSPKAEPEEVVYEVPDPEGDVRRFEMKLPNGNTLTVKDAEIRVDMGGTTLVIEDGGNVTVESAADVTLKAKGDLSLQASGDVKIEAQGTASLKGMSVNAEAQSSAKLKGSTTTIAGTCSFSAG